MISTGFHLREKLNKRTVVWIIGIILILILIGVVAFFSYFRVSTVEVRGSTRYSDEEVKEMALSGPFADNSVLAPLLYSRDVEDIFFVDAFSVTALSRDTIVVSVKEKKPVGCISYLDSYIYFDRTGIFVDGSRVRDEKVPYFSGIEVKKVVSDEKLPIRGTTVLNTAVALSTIFQKNQMLPDHVEFDDQYQISLVYDQITVMLGKDEYLEDKMARVIAILPKIQGRKGILHLESVTDVIKVITFEAEPEEITAENWNGGYDENGDYTGYGEYDEDGNYVGERPMTEYDYALAAWEGGYDGEGDFTGYGEYNSYGVYVGPMPTEESFAAHGDWTGGYTEYGGYTGTGEYDREGNYVGPDPNAGEEAEGTGGDSGTAGSGEYQADSYDSDGSSQEQSWDYSEEYQDEYQDENSQESTWEDPHDESYYDSLYTWD